MILSVLEGSVFPVSRADVLELPCAGSGEITEDVIQLCPRDSALH